jgi:hypothetical protein
MIAMSTAHHVVSLIFLPEIQIFVSAYAEEFIKEIDIQVISIIFFFTLYSFIYCLNKVKQESC